MFESNKAKYDVLFKSENELEELFEEYKPKKASEADQEAYAQLKAAYDESAKLQSELEMFKNNTILSCIESSINGKFEMIVNKHNSGGKLEDCTAEVTESVKQGVDAKLADFAKWQQTIDMKTPFDKIKSILQPTGQKSGIQQQIKSI